MEPISVIRGRACPIDANDVDTDQIIPKQFMKRVERQGFGPFAFFDWRYDEDGEPKPDFPMNKPEHADAVVLVVGRNFGCGSSREHAPWALEDAGFRAIIAPSFADIFFSNCAKAGILCVRLDEPTVRRLFDLIETKPAVEVEVDLPSQRVRVPGVAGTEAVDAGFEVDSHTKRCLLEGLDHIALTLEHESDITAFEAKRDNTKPAVPTG
jgi:3-isopropylmalate/(R)-2-methylmalate dehydratase small subunit